MKESGAELAGEMSGHIFFKHRYYGFDDACYTAGRLLEILSSGKGSVGERLHDVPVMHATPELRLDVTEATKFPIVKKVTEAFKARNDGSKVVDIDGARVEWKDGWGLVRASNTTPILVMRFEALTPERAKELQSLFESEIARVRKELGA
jgi:phosphomannomutase/phosphoglucomutase